MDADNDKSDEIVRAKIRRALLSGPDSITRQATVADMDVQNRPGAKVSQGIIQNWWRQG